MKNSSIALFILPLFLLLVLSACEKDEAELLIDLNAKLLAGNSGQSKTWILKNYFRQVDNEVEEEILTSPTDACTKDNLYTFKNNTNQEYVCDEGVLPSQSGYQN